VSLRTVQTCEMCGRTRSLSGTQTEEAAGWRKLRIPSNEATFCSFCLQTFVKYALSRAHSRAAGIEMPPNIKFWEAQESEQTA
jgi:hypothetical protein